MDTTEQMDMMTMMMMQHLPDFSQSYGDINTNTNTVQGLVETEEFYAHNTSMPFPWSSSTISFSNTPNPIMLQEQEQTPTANAEKRSSMAAMREMIFRIAAMQPVNIDPESVKPPPKRRNVKISKDPQSVAARHRRERISERIRILQRLVPGGTKMDTASMLDEAIHYVKFLKTQVQSLQRASPANAPEIGFRFPVAMSSTSTSAATAIPYFPLPKPYRDAS